MIKVVSGTIRAGLTSLCLIFGTSGSGVAAEQAVTNKEVAKHLTQAKKRAGGKQWNAALAELTKAEQVREASPYAQYKIDEFKAYVFTQQRQYDKAAAVFAKLGKSDQASPAERIKHLKTAARLYMEAKQFEQTAKLAQAALEVSRGDTSLMELLGEAKYLAGDFKGAAQATEQLVAALDSTGSKPKEESLQILLNSYYKLQDRERIALSWDRLLRDYPKPQYWENVLALQVGQSHSEAVDLYYRALMLDLGILDNPADYEALALGALDVGLPAESVRVLEAGFQNGVLATANEARFRRMLEFAKRELAKGEGELNELALNARRASSGQPDVALGRAYMSRHKYEEAIQALQRGIKKGQLQRPDQARVDLGVAYFKNDQPQQAHATFAAVEADSEWRKLADLWSMRVSEAGGRASGSK
jgi:hypothetical protein